MSEMQNPNKTNNLTEDKIKLILEELGYPLTDFIDHWRCPAIYRKGSNPISIKIYKNTGVWHDYGSNLFSQPFGKLIALSDKDHAAEIIGGIQSEDVQDRSQAPVIHRAKLSKLYDTSVLEKLLPHHTFYTNKKDRSISLATLLPFRGGLAMSGKMYQRYVFPIFNESGKINGFDGRNTNDQATERPKWKVLGNKREFLYPLYITDVNGDFFVLNEIERKNEIILVESIGDVLSLHEAGIFNVICVFGIRASDAIICKLIELLECGNVIIAFNNDFTKEENTGLYKAINQLLTLLEFFDASQLLISLPQYIR